MKVQVDARWLSGLLEEYNINQGSLVWSNICTKRFNFTRGRSVRNGPSNFYLEVPDNTREFLKFIEPLGRFSVRFDGTLDIEKIQVDTGPILFFENDYD